MKNIDKLRELTEALPFYTRKEIGDQYSRYEFEEGAGFSWYLYRSGNDLGVHRWFFPKGCKLAEHVHNCKELIVIFEGAVMFTNADKTEVLLKKGDHISTNAGEKHSVVILEDTKVITITIPPESSFPWNSLEGANNGR